MIAAKQTATMRARLFIGGTWTKGQGTFDVFDKFTGEKLGEADHASREQVNRAVESAHESFQTNRLDAWDRYRILAKAAELIERRRNEIEQTIIAESGFPLVDASNEVSRASQIFMLAAEEGKRMTGEGIPIESAPGNAHRMAFTIRVPRGVVCGITSFNAPLTMVSHKMAPALASGNTVIVKPAEQTPLVAAILFEILQEAGLPATHAQLVHGRGPEIGPWLIENPQIAFYSFTGSTAVGKVIRSGVGLRPSALELGSIAASIVCEDADLERAAPRIANAAFRRAGQACTSTQRLFVHEDVLERFTALLVATTGKLPVGDPRDPKTIVGPMIHEREAKRAEEWIREALESGAKLVCGGRRQGALLYPTILTDVRREMRVMCQEIFAPVVSIVPYRSFDLLIDEVNSTPFGLAVGIFTRDVMRAMTAARRLHAGIVHVNEPSASRVDLMPFSGVKESGLGREGPRYAMQEMTEERLITISLA
jgi:succinate-semialdehyde dehydrogenase/glutarate-semialdehyde dehydrogenase